MRREDVEHALDALASDGPAPTADAATLIARGRRRTVRQRVVIIAIAGAVVATAAGVGAVANNNDTRRVVAPVPTTSTTPGFGRSDQIAVASSLEAWKCLNPLQYTDDGGRSWKSVALPTRVPADLVNSCTAVAGANAWANWRDSRNVFHILRIRGGRDPQVFSFPRLPDNIGLGPLTFVDRDHGWVQTAPYDDSGPPAHLYRTIDGGATWKLATTNVAGGRIAFADLERGWSSDGANLSATADGGVTWRAVALPAPVVAAGPVVLFQIEARDDWIVVWRGVPLSRNRYRPFFDFSTDGGQTWSLRAGPKDFELPHAENNAFDAIDGRNWVLTSNNALRITNATGAWQNRPDIPNAQSVHTVEFPTSDVGWITTDTGEILRTIDAGRSWTDVTNGAAPQPSTNTANTTPANTGANAVPPQLAFASGTEGWICGSRLRYSTDDFDYLGTGTTDVEIPAATIRPGALQLYTLCAAAPGGNLWLLRGSADPDRPEIVRVRPAGVRVIPFARIPGSTVVSISFADADKGWALVQHEGSGQHDLYRTADGGQTWALLLEHAPVSGYLEFSSSSQGWASSTGDLASTSDGGRTWTTVNLPTNAFHGGYIRPVLTKGKVIVAVGMTTSEDFWVPFFDVSTDGGRTWSLRGAPHAQLGGPDEGDFSAADADHWALGYRNLLFVTDDGGRTWTETQQFAGLDRIIHVARPSATAMFVSGYGDQYFKTSVVLGTIDDGDHWTTVDEHAPTGPPGNVASFPGGIIGCPTRTVVPEGPTVAIAQAAIAYAHFRYASVPSVYRANSGEGDFAEIFRFNVGSCGADVLENTWVAYVNGTPNAGPGGSTARVTLALAHYDDGWHVFGRYP